jgi:hypothetical protein
MLLAHAYGMGYTFCDALINGIVLTLCPGRLARAIQKRNKILGFT